MMKLIHKLTRLGAGFGLSICLIVSGIASAQTPEELERANNIFKEVRCPVCTVQSLSESDTTLSKNLRQKIIGDIASGKSDVEVLDMLSKTYGDDIRLMPKTEARTVPLWLAPWSVLLIGGLGIYWVRRRRQLVIAKQDPNIKGPKAS